METYSSNLFDYSIRLNNLNDYLICELDYNGIVWKSKITLNDLTSNMINLQKLMTIIKSNKEKIQPNYDINFDLITNSRTNSSHLIMGIKFSNEFIEFKEKIIFTQSNTIDEAKEEKLNQMIISQKKEIDMMKIKIEELENIPLVGYSKIIKKLYIDGRLNPYICSIKNNNNTENSLSHLNHARHQNRRGKKSNENNLNQNNLNHFGLNYFENFSYDTYQFLINNNLDEIKIFFNGINFNDEIISQVIPYKFWLFSFNFQTFGKKFEQDIMMIPKAKSQNNNYEYYEFEKFFGYYIETYYYLKYCRVKKLSIDCVGDDFGVHHSSFLFNWVVNNFSSTNIFDEIEFVNNLPLNDFINSGIRTKKIKIVYDKSFNDNALKSYCSSNGIQFEYS